MCFLMVDRRRLIVDIFLPPLHRSSTLASANVISDGRGCLGLGGSAAVLRGPAFRTGGRAEVEGATDSRPRGTRENSNTRLDGRGVDVMLTIIMITDQ
jgi:hypothetical protein